MRITVQLTPAAARRARSPVGRSRSGRVIPWLEHPLRPVHPATDDPDLETYFMVEVANPAEAARLAARLLEDPSVEAAYIKPADEPA